MSEGAAESLAFGEGRLAYAAGTVAVTFAILVFAEITPKVIGAAHAERIALPLSHVLRPLLRVLYPACPHIAHALWNELGYAAAQGDLLDAAWPAVDEAALVQDEIELVLQINGKLRGAVKVPASADKAAIEAAALATEEFAKFSEGKAPKKVVIVPGRLVNVVV